MVCSYAQLTQQSSHMQSSHMTWPCFDRWGVGPGMSRQMGRGWTQRRAGNAPAASHRDNCAGLWAYITLPCARWCCSSGPSFVRLRTQEEGVRPPLPILPCPPAVGHRVRYCCRDPPPTQSQGLRSAIPPQLVVDRLPSSSRRSQWAMPAPCPIRPPSLATASAVVTVDGATATAAASRSPTPQRPTRRQGGVALAAAAATAAVFVDAAAAAVITAIAPSLAPAAAVL